MENNKVYLIVHPYSNRWSQISALDKDTYSDFNKFEKKYLENITNFIHQTEENLIITQPGWCKDKLQKKMKRIKPRKLIKIIETPGDEWDGDLPEPSIGWEGLYKILQEKKLDEVIIIGAQLGVKPNVFGPKKYRFCVGATYNNMKFFKKLKVRLKENLCLKYDYPQ